jgi:hypothetical protein
MKKFITLALGMALLAPMGQVFAGDDPDAPCPVNNDNRTVKNVKGKGDPANKGDKDSGAVEGPVMENGDFHKIKN